MHFAYKELPANHKQLTLLVVREISDPYPRLAVLSRYRRNNMETEIKPLLTIKDVCPWLRFTAQTIKKMCREGKIPRNGSLAKGRHVARRFERGDESRKNRNRIRGSFVCTG